MEILIILIPISFFLLAIAACLFLWAVNHDQFEQLDKHGFDIFDEDSGENS